MSGLRRLSDQALSGGAAGVSAGQVPVYNSATGHFAPGSAKYNSAGSDYNITETAFRRWRQALAKQRNGEGIAHIAWVGDSTTAGYSLTTPRTQSAVGRAISILSGKFGSGPVIEGYVGPNAYSGSANGYTLGTGWTNYAQGSGAAGPMTMVYAAAGAAGTLDYAPVDGRSWDTAVVVFHHNSAAVVDLWIDSGTHQTVTITNASGAQRATITAGSVAAHTLHIGNVASGQARVAFIAVYDSTQNPNGIQISNMGVGGSRSGPWGDDNTGAGPTTYLAGTKADLMLINLGINDAVNATTTSAYYSSLATIITVAQANACDVLLIVPPIYDPALAQGNYPDHSYLDPQIYALADAYNVGLFDMTKRWGSYATYIAAGYGGYPHPNARAYWDVAQGVADVLLRTA